MLIRRRTLERMLLDRDRAHERDRAHLIDLIREQNDRIMHLAGRTWAEPPAREVAPPPPNPLAGLVLDPEQLPTDDTY